MDSLTSVAPPIVLPASNYHRRRLLFLPRTCPNFHDRKIRCITKLTRRRRVEVSCKLSSSGGDRDGGGDDEEEELKKALELDGTIPGSSDEFVKQVSSRAYDMRRNLQQTFDTSSYDVLEANPWRETSKPVYVLTQRENQLCTMKTRRNRREVENELGKLFSKSGKWKNQAKQSGSSTNFQMFVEDISEGVLVFEDENEASKYCDLLRGGQGCEGVAEIEAASVFDLCKKMRALAVLFRRGRTPPMPESLKLNLRARKRSLEDQDGLK